MLVRPIVFKRTSESISIKTRLIKWRNSILDFETLFSDFQELLNGSGLTSIIIISSQESLSSELYQQVNRKHVGVRHAEKGERSSFVRNKAAIDALHKMHAQVRVFLHQQTCFYRTIFSRLRE